MGDSPFERSITPFLGMYPMLNVDHLQPYFPPLLDTSSITEQLAPIELNLDYMEQATTNQIMNMHIKNTR